MTPQERRDRKARAERAEAELAAIENAENLGYQFYKRFPDLMLIEVARAGYEQFDRAEQSVAFLRGYSQARIRHDDYKQGK